MTHRLLQWRHFEENSDFFIPRHEFGEVDGPGMVKNIVLQDLVELVCLFASLHHPSQSSSAISIYLARARRLPLIRLLTSTSLTINHFKFCIKMIETACQEEGASVRSHCPSPKEKLAGPRQGQGQGQGQRRREPFSSQIPSYSP